MRHSDLVTVASLFAVGLAVGDANAEEPAEERSDDTVGFVAVGAQPALANRVVAHATGQGVGVSGPTFMHLPQFVPPTVLQFGPMSGFAMAVDAARDPEIAELVRAVREREQRMLQNPEYRELLKARQRLQLANTHPYLREMLQISREQANALLNLLAEQQVRDQAEWEAGELTMDRPDVERAIERLNERQLTKEAELQALLGSKFQEWKDYEQSAMARFLVQRLAQSLPQEAALRPEQLRPLVTTIAQEHRRQMEEVARSMPPGEMPNPEWLDRMRSQQQQRMAESHQRILANTSSILSAQQLEQLRQLLDEEFNARANSAIFVGQRAPASPPPQ